MWGTTHGCSILENIFLLLLRNLSASGLSCTNLECGFGNAPKLDESAICFRIRFCVPYQFYPSKKLVVPLTKSYHKDVSHLFLVVVYMNCSTSWILGRIGLTCITDSVVVIFRFLFMGAILCSAAWSFLAAEFQIPIHQQSPRSSQRKASWLPSSGFFVRTSSFSIHSTFWMKYGLKFTLVWQQLHP